MQSDLKILKFLLLTFRVLFWIEFFPVKMKFFFPCTITTECRDVHTRTRKWYTLNNRICWCEIMIRALKRILMDAMTHRRWVIINDSLVKTNHSQRSGRSLPSTKTIFNSYFPEGLKSSRIISNVVGQVVHTKESMYGGSCMMSGLVWRKSLMWYHWWFFAHLIALLSFGVYPERIL